MLNASGGPQPGVDPVGRFYLGRKSLVSVVWSEDRGVYPVCNAMVTLTDTHGNPWWTESINSDEHDFPYSPTQFALHRGWHRAYVDTYCQAWAMSAWKGNAALAPTGGRLRLQPTAQPRSSRASVNHHTTARSISIPMLNRR